MSLEDRIQQAVESALAQMRARAEDDVRTIAQQLVTAAMAEREQAIEAARQEVRDEAARESNQRVADAEARVRATLDQVVADAREKERSVANIEVRRIVEAEAEGKLHAALAAARQELELALANAENRANQAVQEAVTAARVREREADMAAVSRLLDSIRGLDGAATLSEVLDALGLAASREAARAAVLVLRNDRLIGWKLHGFGARDSQPKAIDLALTEAGVAGHAVGSGRPVTTRDSQSAAEGPGFAHLPADRMGLAVPVIVGGRVVAVLYADGVTPDGLQQPVPNSWPEVIEILARHAARCLEALTVQKASTTPSPRFWVPPASKGAGTPRTPGQPAASESGAEAGAADVPPPTSGGAAMSDRSDIERAESVEEAARRFARLLLSEIKLYHEPAVDEGRRSRNLLSRLGPEIERARRVYDQRVPATLRTRAELFHQELVATLAGGDPALLGFQT